MCEVSFQAKDGFGEISSYYLKCGYEVTLATLTGKLKRRRGWFWSMQLLVKGSYVTFLFLPQTSASTPAALSYKCLSSLHFAQMFLLLLLFSFYNIWRPINIVTYFVVNNVTLCDGCKHVFSACD